MDVNSQLIRLALDADGAERPDQVAEALAKLTELQLGNPAANRHIYVLANQGTLNSVRPPVPLVLTHNEHETDPDLRVIPIEDPQIDPRGDWVRPYVYGSGLVIEPVPTGNPFPHHAKGAEVRHYRSSSIYRAMHMLNAGEVDAVVSPGNTGGTVALALLELRYKNAELRTVRPVLPIWLPLSSGPVLLGDVGANPEVSVSALRNSAVMLSAYYVYQHKKNLRPRIGVLTVGEEPSKGGGFITAVKAELADLAGFVGSAEPYQLAEGKIDVAVTDGHTGNIALKMMEMILHEALDPVSAAAKKTPFFVKPLLALLAPKIFGALKETKRRMNRDEVGGAVLLGVSKPVIVSHGSVGALGIVRALDLAVTAHAGGVCEVIREALLLDASKHPLSEVAPR